MGIYTVESAGNKSRAFSAECLCSIHAEILSKPSNTMSRPVMAVFAGRDRELRAFAANLALGKRVLSSNNYSRHKNGMEFLKSAGYKQLWQKESEGMCLTVYLPDIFDLDPGMVDPEGVSFVMAPWNNWLSSQEIPAEEMARYAVELPVSQEHSLSQEFLESLAPAAYLFAVYLDRRTRAPIPPDGKFYIRALLACLNAGLASWPVASYYDRSSFGVNSSLGFSASGWETIGLFKPILFKASHEEVESVLAKEAAEFLH